MKLKISPHIGKIGRLPYEIRCQLGRAIQDGVPGVRLVAWLNSLPEVQAILASDFGGRPINAENFSQWKVRGYPDWIQEQAFAQVTMDIVARNIEKMGGLPSNLQPHDASSSQS